MVGEALRGAAAGSLLEPDDLALSLDVSSFLQSLTDRQLQVMQDGMRQMFTRDEISEMIMDIVKIVTTVSRKIIVPKLGEVLNVDPQTLSLSRPGSSRHCLQSITKDVVKAIVKTIGGSLEEKEDSHMLQLFSSVMDKVELLPPTHGSVERRHSSLPVEPRIEKPKELTSEDQAQLKECTKDMIFEICSIGESQELKRESETDLSYPPKMSIRIREFVDCLLSELVDMTKVARSSLISDDIGSDPARNVHRIPSLMKLSGLAFNMETQARASIPAQTLRNASSYARIFVDELLLQLESITKSEDSDDDQGKFRRGSPDLSRTAELLVDHIMAYIQEVSASPFGDDIPAVPLDLQVPSVLQSSSAKSLEKIQSEDSRTKAAQTVSEILLKSSESLLVGSLRSLRAQTSQTDSSVEPNPSECSAKASAIVDSVIDGICTCLHSSTSSSETQSEPLDAMESGSDVSEENLWSTVYGVYSSAMTELRGFSAAYRQRAAKVDPSDIDVEGTVDEVLQAITDQLALLRGHHKSEEPQLTCDLIRSTLDNEVMDKHPLRPDRSRPVVSPEHTVSLPGTPTPSESSKGEGKESHLQRPSIRIIDDQERPKSRGRVSMATLVDTMMTSLGLQGSGHYIFLAELSAAAKRVNDLILTKTTQKFAEMARIILKDRLTSLNISESVVGVRKLQNHTDPQRHFISEFLGEFADESAKRLLMSCIAPRPASASTEDIPSLVMPFRVTPESFEVSRPPSDVFVDTIDLFSREIVNNVMDSVLADVWDSASSAEETPEINSGSPDKLGTSHKGLIPHLRKHLYAGASSAVPETEGTKNLSLKKLKSVFFKLKMPKINILKKKPKKDNNAGSSDQDRLQSRRTADKSGATSKKEKPWRTIFTRMFSCFRK